MDYFTHDLLHLIADMIKSMQEYEKKICDLMDKKVKEENKTRCEDD